MTGVQTCALPIFLSCGFFRSSVIGNAYQSIVTGKSRGGGCLWLINDKWCTNVTVHRRFCSADLELLHVECRPHYLPREINLINLILVYCVPEADNKICQETISDIIDQCCMKHPESATIIAGDFNNVQLIHLNQYVDFNTRKNIKTRPLLLKYSQCLQILQTAKHWSV